MSVWDSIVGQQRAVELLRATAQGDPGSIAQSWLICGPAGSGRSNIARAFAAALQSEDHGMGDVPSAVTSQVLAGTHPDVTVLATDKVTISIDEVRELIDKADEMPSTAPWRIMIIEDVDRMQERTSNVLLKEIEEPSERTIWLLCAPSAQDVLPTIRSRTRIVNLALPQPQDVARFLVDACGAEPAVASRAARLAEGHIGIAKLYATDDAVLADRDELVVGVLSMRRASEAVVLAGRLIDSAQAQAQAEVDAQAQAAEAEFRRVHGLGEKDRVPPKLRGALHEITKKDELKRKATRRSRDVLDRALTSIASVYRDVMVMHHGADRISGLINAENANAVAELSSRLRPQDAVDRLERIEVARRRLAGNGNPTLVFEALLCALLPAPSRR